MRHGICLTAVYPEAMQNCSRLIKLIREVSKQGIYDCVEFYFEGQRKRKEKYKLFYPIQTSDWFIMQGTA